MKMITADWGAVAESSAERVFAAARRVAPDDDSAWDCVQEAFLTALSSRAPGDLRDPVGWLCGVARNHARHAVRSTGRFRKLLERLVLRKPVLSKDIPPDGREALNLALSRLPAKLRDAVVLKHLARMSVAEVAQAQGISEAAARARIHRGLGRLRAMLGGSLAVALLARAASAGWSGPLAGLATAAKAAAPAALPALAAVSLPKVAALATAVTLVVAGGLMLGAPSEPLPEPPPLAASVPPPRPAGQLGYSVAAAERTAPTPPTGPAVRPAAAPAEPIEIRVRDLADGRGVPGITVVFGVAGTRPLTDGDGRVQADPRYLASPRIEEREWTLLDHPAGEVAATGEIWAYRKVRLLGTVTGERRRVKRKRAEFEPRRVKLSAVPVSDATYGEPAPVPWNPVWLEERGLGPREVQGEPDRYGRFEVEVPGVKGMTVLAHAPGWIPDHERVAFVPGADFAARVSLHLDAAPVVCGKAKRRGRRRVAVYILRAHRLSRFQPDLLPLVGHPFRVDIRKDDAAVTFRAETETESDGDYQLPVHLDGDAIVVFDSAGEASTMARVRIRDGRETEVEPDDRKARGEAAVILRFDKGASPAGARVRITEDPDRASQPTISLTLGRKDQYLFLAAGTVQYGREYEITWLTGAPPRETSARFRWKRQSFVDLRKAARTDPR